MDTYNVKTFPVLKDFITEEVPI